MTRGGDSDDAPALTRAEMESLVPAAKCRGCGVVTWRVSLVDGAVRAPARHKAGCLKPAGRLDLLMRLNIAERQEFMGGRLLRPMSYAEVAEAEKELKRWKSRRI